MPKFYFLLNRIYISDNKEKRKFLGLLGKDSAEIKIVSTVVSEHGQLPDMSAFLSEINENKKRELLALAIHKVLDSRQINEVENIKDNSWVTLGPKGYIVFSSDMIPDSFDWQLLLYESDKDVRDTAQTVQQIVAQEGFNSFVNDVISLAGASANPALATAISVSKYAIKTATDIIKKNKDDLVGIVYASFIRSKDYPGSKKTGITPDLTNNIKTEYSIFIG